MAGTLMASVPLRRALCIGTAILACATARHAGAAGPASPDIRCFADAADEVQLEFRTWEDPKLGWIGGQVRYRGAKTAIPIVFQGSTVLEDHPGRPSEFEHRWLEVYDGAVTGEYRLQSQGAVVYGFKYVARKGGRTVEFPEDWIPDEGDACIWR